MPIGGRSVFLLRVMAEEERRSPAGALIYTHTNTQAIRQEIKETQTDRQTPRWLDRLTNKLAEIHADRQMCLTVVSL